MKKKTICKIGLACAIVMLLLEILILDFDNLKSSFTLSKIISMSISILIGIQMVITMKQMKETNE